MNVKQIQSITLTIVAVAFLVCITVYGVFAHAQDTRVMREKVRACTTITDIVERNKCLDRVP